MKVIARRIALLVLGMGIGTGMTFALLMADHPTIIVETKWKTITTAPPVTYLPETPFHMDPNVCADYVPPTMTTTSVPVTAVKPTIPTPTPTLPPSTLPPSSTTLTSGTTTSTQEQTTTTQETTTSN